MTESAEGGQPPEFPHSSARDVHEYQVDHIRDITSEGKIVLGGGVDTAFRALFPTTYDQVVEHPDDRKTGEDK
ncbi:hypothetical protein [Nonomuraea typhae]|uniref:hypothetical protein n=1 Tax=Nonomuraea typhae TaxID=2603600 RepID=UPI0012F9FFAE|nr:hypothetical protein [Nonomuraea typhae]